MCPFLRMKRKLEGKAEKFIADNNLFLSLVRSMETLTLFLFHYMREVSCLWLISLYNKRPSWRMPYLRLVRGKSAQCAVQLEFISSGSQAVLNHILRSACSTWGERSLLFRDMLFKLPNVEFGSTLLLWTLNIPETALGIWSLRKLT